MKKFDEILKKYGVYGYEKISKAILTSLVAEEPILLTGEHGTGKTMLAERLAVALGSREDEFIAYDASKALFEDVVGFPNPESLKQGKLDYIDTPITIWNKKFILVDEISRANASMQNKWLEIIRSRRIMGRKINNLKYIFAAMNPLGYFGVNQLDEALADRFFLIINIPSDFERSDLAEIINMPDEMEIGKSEELIKLIAEIKSKANSIDSLTRPKIDNFVMDFSQKVKKLGLSFSPRRAAMLKKALTIFFAIDLVENNLNEKTIVQNFRDCAAYGWNYFVIGEEPYLDILKESFLYATRKVNSKAGATFNTFEEYKKKNTAERVFEQNGKKNAGSATSAKTSSATYDDESDIVTMFKILGAGIELFTVGFYEMVIKGNSNWKSKLEINN